MAIEKISNKINTPAELATAVKNFAIQHAGFTDAGAISNANTAFSLRSPQGIYFNFRFTNDAVETIMSNSKLSSYTINGISYSDYAYRPNQYPTWNYTCTANFTYPLVGATLITMGKLVAVVMEIKVGIFRHHVFGKFDSYDPNLSGGEFASGTTTYNSSFNSDSRKPTLSEFSDNLFSNSSLHSPFSYGLNTSSSVSKYGISFIRKDNEYIAVQALSSVNINKCFYQVGSYFTNYAPNQYNGRVMMYPIELYYQSDRKNYAQFIPMFYTQDICRLCVSNLQPEDIVNDDWIVFPIVTKQNNPQNDYGTTFDGVAYRFK